MYLYGMYHSKGIDTDPSDVSAEYKKEFQTMLCELMPFLLQRHGCH